MHAQEYDIFSDSKSMIVVYSVQWVSKELRRSKFDSIQLI